MGQATVVAVWIIGSEASMTVSQYIVVVFLADVCVRMVPASTQPHGLGNRGEGGASAFGHCDGV